MTTFESESHTILKTSSTYITLQNIADILSSTDNQELLKHRFKSSTVNWDYMVMVASRYLMLPAIYCQLQQKALLPYLPPDLVLYLEEITSLNRDRNQALLQQAWEVSELFNNAQIDFVFIKGAAILAHLIPTDIGARMVGDLDIVIAPNQAKKAFKLLEAHGYTKTIAFNYETKNFRHLPRQINPTRIGAIELHTEVLVYKHRGLIKPIELLERRQTVQGLQVPRSIDSIKIAVFTTQLNDHAHRYGTLHLKTIYDCLILGLPKTAKLLETLSAQPYANTFLELSSIYFPEFKPVFTTRYAEILRKYYVYKLKHPKLGSWFHHSLFTFHGLTARIKLVLYNNSYRTHILKNKFRLKKDEK